MQTVKGSANGRVALPIQDIVGPDGVADLIVTRQCSRCSNVRRLHPGENFYERVCPDCGMTIGGKGDGDYYYAYTFDLQADGKIPDFLEPFRSQIMAGHPVMVARAGDADHQFLFTGEALWEFDWPLKNYGPQNPQINE